VALKEEEQCKRGRKKVKMESKKEGTRERKAERGKRK
jgi:hypothetical protein